VIANSERHAGSWARIRIEDNGIGIDEETQERIFEPFFTTKEVGEGTGLGLSTAFAIVRQHDGWIECESNHEGGTVFSVHLPIAKQESTSKAVRAEEAVGKKSAETILIIDDEEIVREVLASQLSRSGYRLLFGTNGKDGLEVFRQERDEISLILLDISMPDMSGREMLPIVRGLSPEVKVIILTGFAADETRFPGAQAVIQKPFKREELLVRIREVLDGEIETPE